MGYNYYSVADNTSVGGGLCSFIRFAARSLPPKSAKFR